MHTIECITHFWNLYIYIVSIDLCIMQSKHMVIGTLVFAFAEVPA